MNTMEHPSLRGRKLERESVSSRQPNRGKGKGGKGKTKSGTTLGSSSFEEFGKVLDVEAKVRGWGVGPQCASP